ncbi:MAG: glycerophosphodiester phosphodiesterase family protein [Brachybacterium sp.]|nr:glycerophosphodiester phosphodiesterase family protein [Brachybacterium sp.]
MHSSTSGTSEPGGEARSSFLPGRRPRVIAHRGLALDGAENTLRAFRDALTAGAHMLETDTQVSADGIAMTVHDEHLTRLTGDAIQVSALPAADLGRRLVAGVEPICTLEEMLDAFPAAAVNIDVKTPDAAEPTARAIARTGAAHRVCLTSFTGSIARAAVRHLERATGVTPVRSPSRGTIAGFLALSAAAAPGAVITRVLAPYGALQVPPQYRGLPVITPRTIAVAHRAGCEVHAWTIDDPEQMRHLLAQGVDGIVTNRADVLSGIVGGHGRAAAGE